MLNNRQILLPMQAQQLGRSYNGRLLIHVEINVKQTVKGELVHQYTADIQDLCVGEVPVLVNSVLCHRPAPVPPACFFIAHGIQTNEPVSSVNGQCKVIVSRT